MPINTDLNTAPYFDDFDIAKQYHKILFKPGYAVQARELTQLQTILQSQIEQFGDNIFKEGSVVKGCNFTGLSGLQFVKLTDKAGFDPLSFTPKRVTEIVGAVEDEYDYVYEIVGGESGLKANIIAASRGFETRPPDLNTFFINYLNTNAGTKQFQAGEILTINLYKFKVGTSEPSATVDNIASISVTSIGVPTGRSFGIQSSPGIVFQKGHFLFASEQTLVVSKYTNLPTNVSVGYRVQERLVSALNDNSLYDNANGSNNENAAGADRLNLVPTLVALETAAADTDATFFTLARYQDGNQVSLRDVSQYNVVGEEMAKRTFEESGNYILNDFTVKTDRRGSDVKALVGTGTAYVKGFRIENTGERSFVVDQITGTEIQQNQPVSFNYGSYVNVLSYNGWFDTESANVIDLLDSGNFKIGETFVASLTPNSVYVYGVRLDPGKNFSEVYKLDGPNGEVTVADVSTTTVLKEARKSPLVFDTGMFSLKETSDTILPIRVQTAATHSANVITLSANPGDDFAVENNDIVVIDSTSTYINVLSAVTTLNSSVLTITLDPADGASPNVTVYYNKRIQDADPYNKVVKTPFIKTLYSSTKTKYSLGFPDVFEIVSVADANDVDYTDSFRLKTNQKDQYYDLSYMEYIQGRPKPANGVELTVGVKVFQLSTSTGEYFFTINSYPNTLDENDIPVYEGTNSVRYNLRECFDFRPYVNKAAAANYDETDPVSAPLITGDVDAVAPSFTNNGVGLLPAVNSSATTDIEYYLNRVDLITIDSYGEIKLVKGKEDRFAVPPKTTADKLAIAEIIVPGFPALSTQEAANQGKREYGIKARSVGVKNYTMKDIKSLERKVDDLVYYVSLSQLESETQNLNIIDENGLSRFKNGFLVDPFNDLSLSDVRNAKFNAAIPFNEKILMPSVKTFPLDLKFKSSTGVSLFPSSSNAKVATLGRNADVKLLSQPYASEFRNCVSNFYKYSGDGVVSPPYDTLYDTTTNPVNLEIDLITPFQDFIDNMQEFIPLTDSSESRRVIGNNSEITTTNRQLTFTEQTGQNLVGDFVTNFQFNPYMASRDIKVYMSGLRPNTQHYFFFDGVDVNNSIIPGTPVNNADSIERNGLFGQSVLSDSNGVLRAVFNIPEGTFFVGDRVLEIADVDQYESIDSGSTSRGFVTYRAYNFSVEKVSLTTSTRAPDFDMATTTTTRNLPIRPIGGRDPLAQTFFVKSGMGKGSNSVFLSKVDLFFKRKSFVNGVTVMIREVLNGYPTSQAVPFSKVHFLPSQVNVSDDASVVTTFTFEAPVRLDVEKEYSIVVMPDANDPNYLVFTSKVGGVDLTPGATQGQSIVQDWGDGVLFTSTNDRAWKSYQDEDVKFTLYRHEFNSSAGRVTLTQRDHEFLSLNDITARFKVGETVYQEKAVATTVSATSGSTTITGTNFSTDYVTGDFILLQNASRTTSDIFKVMNVNSSTSMTLNKSPTTNIVNGLCTPIVIGKVSYYNKRNPDEIHLSDSSARQLRLFQADSNIVGFDSGATANLVSVNNINLSYIQPMIIKANDSVSSTDMTGTFVSPTDVNVTYDMPMKFNDNNHFNTSGAIIYSKSNDVNNTKSFEINIDFGNESNSTSTAFLDIEVSKLLAYQYRVTNDADTTATYISKTIELSEDLDAEDMEVIVTGYRPVGTDIKVYIRPQNEFDSDNFESIDWVELELFEGVGMFSSTSNISDYREFKYKVSDSNKDVNGALTYTSNAGDFSGYRKFAIRIDMLAENVYSVPTLRDYRGIALT